MACKKPHDINYSPYIGVNKTENSIAYQMNVLSIFESNVISTLKFKKMGIECIPILRKYFKSYPSHSCDFTIGGTLMWTDYFDYKYAEIDNSLIIMGHLPEDDIFLFYQPRGDIEYGVFKDLVTVYCNENDITGIILEPIESDSSVDVLTSYEENEFIDSWKEYLYDIDKFCAFSGRSMEKKRNHLNYFVNNFSPYEVVVITEDLIAELIAYTIRFNGVHRDNELANYECGQVIEVLSKFRQYSFEGIALRKNNEIIGFSMGEKIGDTFFVHIEKGDIAMRGAYQAIASHLARYVADKYPDVKYLNREEDMGDESLRRSKESYHPSMFIYKKKDVVPLP